MNENSNQMLKIASTEVEYPPTKVMFSPDTSGSTPDLLAISGLTPQLYEIDDGKIELKCSLDSSSENLSPCTSFDWNRNDPDRLATCSLDTTVTVWSIEGQQAVRKLIAHDKEVYDISFSSNPDMFGTVGGDGSLRTFDLRCLEHSTILYESRGFVPLLRLSWNYYDVNFISTFIADSNKIVVLDVRKPAIPYAELTMHQSSINGMKWCPNSSTHMCSCSTDRKCLIYDLYPIEQGKNPTAFQYEADAPINDVDWSITNPDLICVSVGNKLQALRI